MKMAKIKGIRAEITPLNARKRDNRGTAWDFWLAGKRHFLVFVTKRGKVRACHYHLGKSGSKNPEETVHIFGRLRLFLQDRKTGRKKTFLITKPSRIRVWPGVYHEYHALTDCWLLELNEEDFVPDDVVWPYGRGGVNKPHRKSAGKNRKAI
jgi:hypothetical protein